MKIRRVGNPSRMRVGRSAPRRSQSRMPDAKMSRGARVASKNSTPPPPPTPVLSGVNMTVTSATFNPTIELHEGTATTVEWYDEGDNLLATGLSPTIDFGVAGERVVRMAVAQPERVAVVNLGFDASDDYGKDSLPAQYNKPAEQVVAIDGLQHLPNLWAFMAANGPLSGHLDLNGCSALEYVECYASDIQSVDLTGCSSLSRLVVELNQLTQLNLNPVRGTLRDLRAAAMQGGSLTLAPLTGPMQSLWHFCVRGQVTSNIPSYTNLPVVEQFWVWNNGLTGPLKVQSNMLNSVQVSSSTAGASNNFSSIDLSNSAWSGGSANIHAYGMNALSSISLSGSTGYVSTIRAYSNSLTSFDFGGITAGTINLHNNNFDTPTVDAILATVDGWGTSGGTLTLQTNSPPTVANGQPHIAALQGRGWTVTSGTPIANTLIWEDNFERADGPLTSPWQPAMATNPGAGAVSSGQLVFSGGSGFQRLFALPTEINATDIAVEVEFDGDPNVIDFFGVLFHMDAAGNGCKAFLRDGAGTAANVRMDSTMTAAGTTPSAVNPVPASWLANGTHTMMVRVIGTTAELYLDEVLCFTRNSSVFSDVIGNGVGLCGELPGKTWNRITVRAL